MIPPFTLAPTPRVHFGRGVFQDLGAILAGMGKRVLIVTGSRSLEAAGHWDRLTRFLEDQHLEHFNLRVAGEPSPDLVDGTVAEFKGRGIDLVLAVGGGSVVDAGKAVAAMLPHGGSVAPFLEGVGTGAVHSGEKIPFVAVPTTSGTGGEATKNAVLSQVGQEGFKKSLRHDNFIPDVALIDPELILSCPPDVTAACALDAFTQLLEAYTSVKAFPITDALAWSGMEAVRDCLIPAYTNGAEDVQARAGMAYASFISGVVLVNAGLGIVHGLAGPLGGYFQIPHGVACGTLVAAATRENIGALQERDPHSEALEKYAQVGRLLTRREGLNLAEACTALIDKLEGWIRELALPPLSDYGIQTSDCDRIGAGTGQKNNPVELTGEEIRNILLRRMT